jgi:cytochrome c-type biogenesis protein CcmH/NrfF
VLVNFFASWCAPCLAEHPLFTRLKEREGATIVGIAWKDKPEATRAWLARLGDPFARVGFDQDGKLALDWGLSGVPETYLIDGQGIVRLHFRGPLTERDLGDDPAAAAGRVVTPVARSGRAAGSVALLARARLPALAVEPSEMLKDPALEARAREIGRALRCVVCQNQAIDDSNAEVAHDMRRAVRERLAAGDSDAQVFAFMVARYGDYVLLKPPFKPGTWLLWLGGPLVLLVGGGALLLAAARRAVGPAPAPLTRTSASRALLQPRRPTERSERRPRLQRREVPRVRSGDDG